jgi:hypothetical protein
VYLVLPSQAGAFSFPHKYRSCRDGSLPTAGFISQNSPAIKIADFAVTKLRFLLTGKKDRLVMAMCSADGQKIL